MSLIDGMLSDKIFQDAIEMFDKTDSERTFDMLREERLSMDEEEEFHSSVKGLGGKFW